MDVIPLRLEFGLRKYGPYEDGSAEFLVYAPLLNQPLNSLAWVKRCRIGHVKQEAFAADANESW